MDLKNCSSMSNTLVSAVALTMTSLFSLRADAGLRLKWLVGGLGCMSTFNGVGNCPLRGEVSTLTKGELLTDRDIHKLLNRRHLTPLNGQGSNSLNELQATALPDSC